MCVIRQAAPWLALLVLGGCLPRYERGALLSGGAQPDPQARQVGCLDLRVGLIRDPAVPASWPVLGFDLGNGCDRAVAVDLRRVQVRARYAGGREHRAVLFDPRGEVGAATLDGRWSAREELAFVPPPGVLDLDAVEGVCVDVAAVSEGGEATPPVCIERREGT